MNGSIDDESDDHERDRGRGRPRRGDESGDGETYRVAPERGRDSDDAGLDEPPTVDPSIGSDQADSSPGPDPGGGQEPPGPPDPPDSEIVRNWTALTVALAVIAFASAVTIFVAHGDAMAAAGAAVLGAGLGAIAVAGRTTPIVFGRLHDAWAEHRAYVWFSTGLFAVGVVLGGLLYAAGVDLTELFLELIMEELGEDELPGDGEAFELSASFFILNNTPPFLAAIFGALTLGFLTVIIMVFNGILIGNIALITGLEAGFGVILVLLAPHGIFELPALFIAAGVGFRFLHRAGQRLLGTRDALFTREYVLRTTTLVVFAWLLLVLAAFIEAYLTILIADTLFPAQA